LHSRCHFNLAPTAVARKFARDLLTDDPELDVERFLKDCRALSQSP
jgi:hypothetical protein